MKLFYFFLIAPFLVCGYTHSQETPPPAEKKAAEAPAEQDSGDATSSEETEPKNSSKKQVRGSGQSRQNVEAAPFTSGRKYRYGNEDLEVDPD